MYFISLSFSITNRVSKVPHTECLLRITNSKSSNSAVRFGGLEVERIEIDENQGTPVVRQTDL